MEIWATYRMPGMLSKLTLGGGINWQSDITHTISSAQLPSKTIVKQGVYAVVNLMARYDFTHSMCAILNIGNVFGKKYPSSLDTAFNTGFYGAPRNAMLTLNYRFD